MFKNDYNQCSLFLVHGYNIVNLFKISRVTYCIVVKNLNLVQIEL